ncbi:MAG: RNA polymerase sigma factor [Phycisphaerae bacterium]
MTRKDSMHDDLDDIICRAREADEAAFEELFRRFNWYVLHVIRRQGVREAEDVAQQVWMAVRTSIDQFDTRVAGFATWLRIVARRKAINAAVRRQRYEDLKRRFRTELRADFTASTPVPDAAMSEEETAWAAEQCVSRLDRRKQDVFRLVMNGGFSRPEIARQLGITSSGVRRILSEARAEILACLREKGVL